MNYVSLQIKRVFSLLLLLTVFVGSLFAQNTITMTTVASTSTVKFSLSGSDITINWGDGMTETKKGNLYNASFSHSYSGSSPRTITITGTNITMLRCGSNYLTGLEVSGCSTLKELNCTSNDLTSLDVSKNSRLELLDVSKNIKLTMLVGCDQKTLLKTLDVSGCSALKELSCKNSLLSTLRVSGCIALKELHCSGNQLKGLNVSGCIALEKLLCSSNLLERNNLNVSGCNELYDLECGSNYLTSLDVSKNSKLSIVLCNKNKLESLNVGTNNRSLTRLWLSENNLKDKQLDALFTQLNSPGPARDGGERRIRIGDNPGTGTCKTEILTNRTPDTNGKRWRVIPPDPSPSAGE